MACAPGLNEGIFRGPYTHFSAAGPGGMICGNHKRWLWWLAFIPG